MQKTFIFLILVFVLNGLALSQKLSEPQLLGTWIAGEDPSEFLLHRVMERSEALLTDNSEGKLIVRICSLDNFATAFVKAPLNPLAASQYNQFQRIIVPYEKIYIANSSKCFRQGKFNTNEYWFVPGKNTLEYDEIYSVKKLSYKTFVVDDYDDALNKNKKGINEENKFNSEINAFVSELKSNSEAKGFIIHNSKNKTMSRNIKKVSQMLQKENISLQRAEIVVKISLETTGEGKLKPIKDEKKYFPQLRILVIEK